MPRRIRLEPKNIPTLVVKLKMTQKELEALLEIDLTKHQARWFEFED